MHVHWASFTAYNDSELAERENDTAVQSKEKIHIQAHDFRADYALSSHLSVLCRLPLQTDKCHQHFNKHTSLHVFERVRDNYGWILRKALEGAPL